MVHRVVSPYSYPYHLIHSEYNENDGSFNMRKSVYFAKKVFFARIFDLFFQIIISGENERQEGKGEEDRFRSQRERERDHQRKIQKETQKGLAPPPLAVVHLMEDGVPHRSFHISPKIFIEAVAWSTVACSYFQCLAHLEVVH